MISIKDVSFSYENGSAAGQLNHISLDIPSGQCVVLCGSSGSGKTTLTRIINGLIPHYYEGFLSGSVDAGGKNITEQPLYETAGVIGSVFQNPASQFFCTDTDSELVFGCENLRVDEEEIRKRRSAAVSLFHLEGLTGRAVFTLSGGEKQKLACASVGCVEPAVIVLDEPSSNLDIKSIHMLEEIITAWKKAGVTIIAAEHRLWYLMGVADRVLYLKNGEIGGDFTIGEFAALGAAKRETMGLRPCSAVSFSSSLPVSSGKTIDFAGFRFMRRKKGGKKICCLDIPSLSVPQGHIIGIVGPNGAGKSTFARCLSGLERYTEGGVSSGGKNISVRQRLSSSFMVMQDINHQLFTESVLKEVILGVSGCREKVYAEAEHVIRKLDLKMLEERHPMSLSGGQKQRVAVAAAVLSEKPVLIFDEPTSGLDLQNMRETASLIGSLSSPERTIFIISHDPELLDRCCDWFIFIENGTVRWSGGRTEENLKKLALFFE
jgi:energy-coupling factor transport system ATP-binding protein